MSVCRSFSKTKEFKVNKLGSQKFKVNKLGCIKSSNEEVRA